MAKQTPAQGAETKTVVATVAISTPLHPLCLVNPKKPGSKSHARFALYAEHRTVQGYVNACVASGQSRRNATADIAWDTKHGFIVTGPAAIAAAEGKQPE